MKNIFIILAFFSFSSIAQNALPRFVNDTLYTSSGYKIYKGQILHFGTGTGKNGNFKFIKIKNSTATTKSLANTTAVVKEFKNYGISVLNNGYIEIEGTITYKDSSRGYLDIHIAFDRAIENSLELPGELIVPTEFRNNQKIILTEKLTNLYKLYKKGKINKAQYDEEEKKLLTPE